MSNNYKIYQVFFDEYNVEIEYWNPKVKKKEFLSLNVNDVRLTKVIDFLEALGFVEILVED